MEEKNAKETLELYKMMHELTDNEAPYFMIEMDEFLKAIADQDFVRMNNIRKAMGEDFGKMGELFALCQQVGMCPGPKSQTR